MGTVGSLLAVSVVFHLCIRCLCHAAVVFDMMCFRTIDREMVERFHKEDKQRARKEAREKALKEETEAIRARISVEREKLDAEVAELSRKVSAAQAVIDEVTEDPSKLAVEDGAVRLVGVSAESELFGLAPRGSPSAAGAVREWLQFPWLIY